METRGWEGVAVRAPYHEKGKPTLFVAQAFDGVEL
jgi:hypothetical protein